MALLNRRRLARAHHRSGLARLAAGALLLATVAPAQAAGGSALEYAVKANYLYKLGPFVEWPPETFSGPTANFTICVAGEDPFGATLDEAVRGQAVQGRPVLVRRMASVTADAGCHVLYLGRLRGQTPAEALRLVHGAPVLTVTDERLGGAGGIVQFVLKDGRVRFAINPAAAQGNGLALSSKLLALSVGPAR